MADKQAALLLIDGFNPQSEFIFVIRRETSEPAFTGFLDAVANRVFIHPHSIHKAQRPVCTLHVYAFSGQKIGQRRPHLCHGRVNFQPVELIVLFQRYAFKPACQRVGIFTVCRRQCFFRWLWQAQCALGIWLS